MGRTNLTDWPTMGRIRRPSRDGWLRAALGEYSAQFLGTLTAHHLGTPYFYLTSMDPSAADVAADPRASLAVSAMPLGTCGDADPESPLCAKLTLSGQLHRVLDPEELSFAEHALFTRHPEMQTWPKDHHFQVFKLVLANVFLINGFGGPRHITVEQYYSASSGISDSTLTRG
ncbi:unnamed protein product [Closterium sp. Naga37s-1]|nr:unnamed protein product [Closterium sp. Naga37s-1]